MAGHAFHVLPGTYAVCRLAPHAARPGWATGAFVSITATADAVSIICPAAQVPAEIRAERHWRLLKLAGPFPFGAIGVLAAFTAPLALAQVSVLTVATYDTDYLLVPSSTLETALRALAAAGHPRFD